MKKLISIRYSATLLAMIFLFMAGCVDPIFDYGYDGELAGSILDPNGNIVSGDIKVATFAVHAHGELDQDPMVLRVRDDGTYANTKLYPQSYEVSLVGPFVESPVPPVTVDLTGGKKVEKDFTVTPFLTISEPSISGNPSSNQISVNYNITGNGGNTAGLREIYVSTVSWPTRTTGSGAGYFTRLVVVDDDQGTAVIDGLQPNTRYFVRIGARASGQGLFNHSKQVSVTTAN